MSAVKAIVIRAAGDAELVEVEPDLATLRTLIGGGYLEAISPMIPGYGNWHGYVDEEGKLKGLTMNSTGTDIVTMLGWGGTVSGDFICGPIVLLGDAPHGEEGDVPKKVIDAVLAFYDRHGEVHISHG